jgi:hypothetical protein
MTRTRLLVALLVAVAIGLAAGWIATQVPAKQERTGDSAVEVRKQLQGGPAPTRQPTRQ